METREDMFRDLCENANDLIQSVSYEGRLLYVNRAWLHTLGYTREEAESLSIFDVIHPDSQDHCRQVMQQLLTGGSAVYIEAEFVAKDGRRVPVEGSAGCRFEDGRPVATRGVFRDVSKRLRAEEELDRLFNMSLDMLCIAGVDGYFKRINPAFEKTLGYTTEELLSRSFVDFVHPDDRKDTVGEIERQEQGLPVLDFHNRYRAKDGSYRWLAWRSAPMKERGLVYAVARDITEQKLDQERLTRQAEELARSNAELERFAYVASHDLLAPLRSISQLAEWLQEEVEKGDRAATEEHLRELQVRVRRMETLTGDLLQYSRAGKVPVEVSHVNTEELVRELTFLLAPPEGFRVIADDSLPVLETARAPLEQVLRNLMENAIKHHGAEDGTVTVSGRALDGVVEFQVADDGPGIAEKYQERVFQMFQKLESRDKVEGNGMGLALVKRIVERFGGQVSLNSEEGRGSTFRFTWPRSMKEGG